MILASFFPQGVDSLVLHFCDDLRLEQLMQPWHAMEDTEQARLVRQLGIASVWPGHFIQTVFREQKCFETIVFETAGASFFFET